MSPQDAVWVNLWLSAKAQPLGIFLKVTDKDAVVQKLNAIRRKMGDPDLDNWMIRSAPNDPMGEVWLVRKT